MLSKLATFVLVATLMSASSTAQAERESRFSNLRLLPALALLDDAERALGAAVLAHLPVCECHEVCDLVTEAIETSTPWCEWIAEEEAREEEAPSP